MDADAPDRPTVSANVAATADEFDAGLIVLDGGGITLALSDAGPTLPQVIVGSGIATAAGCQLAATCDMVVASDHARFGVNGVNIGLFCSTPIVALSRKIPHSAAFELAATGEFLTATRAQSLGLANRVTSAEDLTTQTMALAQTLAQKLPAALSIGKAAFAAQTGLPLDQAYAAAGAAMVDNLLDTSTSEGISAFLEKRPPNWA